MDQPPHERLKVWQLSHELALAMYRLAEWLPAPARFELGGQLRRAAFGIPTNLTESLKRHLREIRRGIRSGRENEFPGFLLPLIRRSACGALLLLNDASGFVVGNPRA